MDTCRQKGEKKKDQVISLQMEVQNEEMLAHLHIHFWVTAACFLGFNLKKRKMPNTLAYVARTHCRGKKARSANDLTLVGEMCLI